MAERGPPRVTDIEAYWTSQPPARSQRCEWWQIRIACGWRPNKRIRSMGYYPAAEYFGVYIWEYLNVLFPALKEPHPRG